MKKKEKNLSLQLLKNGKKSFYRIVPSVCTVANQRGKPHTSLTPSPPPPPKKRDIELADALLLFYPSDFIQRNVVAGPQSIQ
jgi:hypothetical protein